MSNLRSQEEQQNKFLNKKKDISTREKLLKYERIVHQTKFFGKINEIHKMDELTNKKRKNR